MATKNFSVDVFIRNLNIEGFLDYSAPSIGAVEYAESIECLGYGSKPSDGEAPVL